MNEHAAFLRLAATAVDFPLNAGESDALSQHIDGCDSCRRAADAFRWDATALRSLPRRSPSPRVTAAIMRAARGETRRTRPPLFLLGVGFLLVVGVAGAIVGGGLLRQLFVPQPRPNNGPTAAPTVALVLPAPSAVLPSVDPRLGSEWQVVGTAGVGDGRATTAWAVTAGGPGFVAVGHMCQLEPPVCWGSIRLSRDGVTWEELPRTGGLEMVAPESPAALQPTLIGVAARPGAIVAIGYATNPLATVETDVVRSAVWISGDGRTWSPVDTSIFDGARVSDIVATTHGFVIVGADYSPRSGGPRGAIWYSDDGRAWHRVLDAPIFNIGGYIPGPEKASGGPRRVASAGGGAVVSVGAVCDDAGLNCRPAFWWSQDGSLWDLTVLDEPNARAEDIVATPQGFLAVGSANGANGCEVRRPCDAKVFTSPDGRTWERRAITVPDPSTAPDVFTDAFVVGDRIIAISHELDGVEQPASSEPVIDGSGARYWSSRDGLTWAEVDGIPRDFSPSPLQPMAGTPQRLVIVGTQDGRIVVSPKD
jgi:hypothetical protein